MAGIYHFREFPDSNTEQRCFIQTLKFADNFIRQFCVFSPEANMIPLPVTLGSSASGDHRDIDASYEKNL